MAAATHVLQVGGRSKMMMMTVMGHAYHLSGPRKHARYMAYTCMCRKGMGELARPISTLATTSHDNSSNTSSTATAATSTKVKLCGATKAIRLIGGSVWSTEKKKTESIETVLEYKFLKIDIIFFSVFNLSGWGM